MALLPSYTGTITTNANNCAPFTAWPWMVGFESQINQLNRMRHQIGSGSNYPPYNIIKSDEDVYRLEVAIAGFSKEDLTVTVQDSVLLIEGSKKSDDETDYVHRGIAGRSFKQNFVLADYVEVTAVTFKDGILTVNLAKELPDSKKPRVLDIL